jgi:hypothetical protein
MCVSDVPIGPKQAEDIGVNRLCHVNEWLWIHSVLVERLEPAFDWSGDGIGLHTGLRLDLHAFRAEFY